MQFFQSYTRCRAGLRQANAARQFAARPELEHTVREMCEAVRVEGDEALLRFTRQFDCLQFELSQLRVSEEEIEAAWRRLPEEMQNTLRRTSDSICYRPIERVGWYEPYGRADYPSTVLMLAILARVAGGRDLVLVSPPPRDGSSHPVILATAKSRASRKPIASLARPRWPRSLTAWLQWPLSIRSPGLAAATSRWRKNICMAL